MTDMNEQVQGEAPPTPDLDQLTKIYLRIRDTRDDMESEHKKRIAQIEEQLSIVQQELLELCKNMNADSIRTPHGTIIRSIKSRYWTNDWDSMYQLIKEHNAFGLLEKRLHQTHMKEFLSENPDLIPIGLNVENSYSVVVRRSKGN